MFCFFLLRQKPVQNVFVVCGDIGDVLLPHARSHNEKQLDKHYFAIRGEGAVRRAQSERKRTGAKPTLRKEVQIHSCSLNMHTASFTPLS